MGNVDCRVLRCDYKLEGLPRRLAIKLAWTGRANGLEQVRVGRASIFDVWIDHARVPSLA
jgi:hypothetical protein